MKTLGIRHRDKTTLVGTGASVFSDILISSVKLAADETKDFVEGEAIVEQDHRKADSPAGRGSPRPHGKMVRVEVDWDIPMSVPVPIQVQPDAANQHFPFLDTTLADLGIEE